MSVGYFIWMIMDLAKLRKEIIENKPEGYELPELKYFMASVVMTFVCMVLRRAARYLLFDAYMRNMQDKYTGELREIRARRGAEYVYQAIYFALVSLWGYSIIKDLPYLHYHLGGTATKHEFF